LLRLILQSLHLTVTPHVFQTVHFLFRKLAHLTEYAIFAMLVYGSGREDDPFRWLPGRALWSLIIVGVYSATDEFHQRFVPGRGPSVVDSAIDTIGAALGMLLFYLRAMRLQIASSRAAATRESALEK
jgi:VanZ family protein